MCLLFLPALQLCLPLHLASHSANKILVIATMQLTWCMIAFQLNAKTVDPTAMTMENYKNQAIKEDLNLRFGV